MSMHTFCVSKTVALSALFSTYLVVCGSEPFSRDPFMPSSGHEYFYVGGGNAGYTRYCACVYIDGELFCLSIGAACFGHELISYSRSRIVLRDENSVLHTLILTEF
jgi:hypothetical protein